MIKADHKYLARLLYDFYIKRLLRSNFQHFFLTNDFPNIPDNEGLIVTPNHFSWWDGFFVDYAIKPFCKRKLFIMMLEEQLKTYWFFKKIGAFSINQKNPKSISTTLNYTIETLNNAKNVLIFYPQGEIEVYDKRPLIVKKGLKVLISMSDFQVNILPVAFKIKYGNNKKPDVVVRFGKLLASSELKDNFNLFVDEFNLNISLLDKEIDNNYMHNLLAK